MELKGTLATMSVPELLQWVADANKTGTLTISSQSEKKDIYFKDGLIISASSNLDKDRFGVVLVKEGYLTQEKLLELLDEGRNTKKMLGRLCVEKGLLSEKDTQRMLQQQAEQIIESVFHRTEGEFTFSEDELPAQDLVQISIIMHQLFFDSANKRKEWRRIQSILGRMDSILKPTPLPPEPLNSLSEFELSLVTLCNGKNTISEICAKIHKSDFEICLSLTKLVERKWLIKTDNPATQSNEILHDNMWQSSILLEQKRFLKAVTLLEDTLKKYPGRADLESLLSKARKSLEIDIKETLGSEDQCPYLVQGFDSKSLQNINLKPQDWFIYSRINGQTPLRELYRITGIGREMTQRTVYLLLRTGAIALKRGDSAPKTTTGRIPPIPDKKTDTQTFRRLTSTGEFKIPDEFFEKNASSLEIESDKAPDIKELEAIYQKYLKQNYYDMLNISPLAQASKIREAFVNLSRKYHPDVYFQKLQPNVQERMEELFSMINSAYRILSNPTSRKRYDEDLWANERYRKDDLKNHSSLFSATSKTDSMPTQRPRPSEPAATSKSEKKPPPRTEPLQETSQKEGMKVLEQTLAAPDQIKKNKWESLYEEGKQLAEAKKYKQAIETFENAVKLNAKNADMYFMLSKLYLKIEKPNHAKAEENIKKALVLQPENGLFFCQLAKVYMEKGEDALAEKFVKTALAWDSDLRDAKKIKEALKNKSKGGFFNMFKKKQ